MLTHLELFIEVHLRLAIVFVLHAGSECIKCRFVDDAQNQKKNGDLSPRPWSPVSVRQ